MDLPHEMTAEHRFGASVTPCLRGLPWAPALGIMNRKTYDDDTAP